MFSTAFIKMLQNDFAVNMIDLHCIFICDDYTEYLIELGKKYITLTDLDSDVELIFEYEREILEHLQNIA